MYGIKGKNLEWFRNYLTNRKQYIKTENSDTDKRTIVCGVPQGSILGPLLFLLYVNDLPQSSDLLDPIMFADDTNLFFEHENISTLFSEVNNELMKINEWFKANKLSLNVEKTKYSLFHKSNQQDNIPLKLPNLVINGHKIEKVNTIRFLGVILDENLSWKFHIKYIENKISKTIGILNRAKPYLDKSSMLSLYSSTII